MDEPMARDSDDSGQAFDAEMTETDEANAPDDTGPTHGHDSPVGDERTESSDRDQVGI